MSKRLTLMEGVQPETAADIATLTPLIQAKQRQIAERVQTEQLADKNPERPIAAEIDNPVEALKRSLKVRNIAHQQEVDAEKQNLKSRLADGLGSSSPVSGNAAAEKADANQPSDEEQRVIDQLQERDREVRDHELAHARVGGAYAGQPSYTYQTGPDGKRYAIGGSVSIDTSPVPNNPEATISKLEVIKRAALAPAEPSSTDRSVAAFADAARAQALADLTRQRSDAAHGPAQETGGSLDTRA